jgi:hypothetical protein
MQQHRHSPRTHSPAAARVLCLPVCSSLCRYRVDTPQMRAASVNVEWGHYVYRSLAGDYIPAIAALTSQEVAEGEQHWEEGVMCPPAVVVVLCRVSVFSKVPSSTPHTLCCVPDLRLCCAVLCLALPATSYHTLPGRELLAEYETAPSTSNGFWDIIRTNLASHAYVNTLAQKSEVREDNRGCTCDTLCQKLSGGGAHGWSGGRLLLSAPGSTASRVLCLLAGGAGLCVQLVHRLDCSCAVA